MVDRIATTWQQADDGRTYFVEMGLAALALFALTASPFFLPVRADNFILAESGPVQVLSAAFYLVVAVTFLREADWGFVARRWYFVLVPIAMCLRELDFHTHFTTMTITKTSFYLSPEVPLGEKLFGVAVFAALGTAGVLMLRNHGRAFLQGLRRLDPAAVAIALAVLCTVASKTLDGAARKLGDWGLVPSAQLEVFAILVEETFELGIPIYMAIAAFAYLGPVLPRKSLADR